MSTLTETSTWSATINQIESGELLKGGAGEILNQAAKELADRSLYLRDRLDDSSTANDKIWSANKTNTEITNHTTTANIHTVLDDSSTANDRLLSAAKILSEIDTVKLNASIHSANYTVSANNEFVFADTSGGIWTLTLPAAPTIGYKVIVCDLTGDWSTNNLTVARNGNNLNGAAEDLVCDVDDCKVELVYANATIGWKIT